MAVLRHGLAPNFDMLKRRAEQAAETFGKGRMPPNLGEAGKENEPACHTIEAAQWAKNTQDFSPGAEKPDKEFISMPSIFVI
jgi:hypothetical protein